jgi:lysophospholipase L1-like esterase
LIRRAAMSGHWIGTWATSPMNVWAGDAVLYGFHDQTVRQIVKISKGGHRFRIRFSNEYGATRIVISGAAVARATGGGAIEPNSSRTLTFGGRPEGLLVGGAPLISDPVELEMEDLGSLAISVYFKGFAQVETYHFTARQTAYISKFGDFVTAAEMPLQQTSESTYFLGGVLVEADADCRAIVCFGDSITDGTASTVDANSRWPNHLAARLSTAGKLTSLTVLNQGLDGNRLATGRGRGAAALARFDRDVLSQPNVGYVVILEGINDIGWPHSTLAPDSEAVSVDQIIGCYQQLIDRAQMRGIKVFLGTLTAFGGSFEGHPYETFFTEEKEAMRQAVNAWIRASSGADAVIDFDRATTDRSSPPRLLPQFDCGDHLHPSDAGYKAMADAIDLALFD